MILRDYQEEMLAGIRISLSRCRSVLCVAPCGSGKGSLTAYMVAGAVRKGKSVIFAVHGKSLCHDMSARVTKLGVEHGVLVGGHRRDRKHAVQIASIDTLHRMEYPPEADLIICDEADMTGSPTWKKAMGRYPAAKIIGLTATPCRLDGQGLGKASGGLFEEMIVGPAETEMIRRGYLVGSRVFVGNVPVIPAEARNNDKKLAQVCDKATIIGDIVTEWKKNAGTLKTLAFGVDCAHAHHITDSFNAAGIPWAYVDADTPEPERQRTWRELSEGNLMGVSNVGIATVGFDQPAIQCLIMARFTSSLRLWKQMLGRGSRPYPGKENFVVLDHVGCSSFHAPYGRFEDAVEWSLDGAAVQAREGVEGPQIASCWGPPVSIKTVDGVIRKYPCRGSFRAGPRECPYCGYPLPVKARTIDVIAGELRELNQHPSLWLPDGIIPHVVSIADRKKFLYQMIGVVRKTHLQPDKWRAWVGKRFRERYAAEPPRDWMRNLP